MHMTPYGEQSRQAVSAVQFSCIRFFPIACCSSSLRCLGCLHNASIARWSPFVLQPFPIVNSSSFQAHSRAQAFRPLATLLVRKSPPANDDDHYDHDRGNESDDGILGQLATLGFADLRARGRWARRPRGGYCPGAGDAVRARNSRRGRDGPYFTFSKKLPGIMLISKLHNQIGHHVKGTHLSRLL